ncbi:ferredoxin family protein [Acetonema longum]|uniref:4Fe-4S ferredoxin iron-sulfur binding domain protein n=1 Tax=Acetonema longum DSM 6540 TaxID=1009370 RepID=F7NMW8_9FIRM|nr:ferredoxin family protein [Acetonema longum]EGO62612.1 4Fe-4S ferredoxin iron-sulfur binding domain protein [Acetonema longum DSM 6540]
MNQVKIEFDRCKECGYCVNFCPQKVLLIGDKVNKRGYYPPAAALLQDCIACGTCARVCPEAAIAVYKES